MTRPDPDRRRFLLATLVTLLALPALWWINQDDDSAAPNVATVGVEVGDDTDAATTGEAATEADGDGTEPVFLDGPFSANPGAAEIAVPAAPDREPIVGTASYSSVRSITLCFTRGIVSGRELTVVNLDNTRSTTCVAQPPLENQTTDVVLHTRAYNQLADLTDAPIPVEIRP